jgi:hypothetical protein
MPDFVKIRLPRRTTSILKFCYTCKKMTTFIRPALSISSTCLECGKEANDDFLLTGVVPPASKSRPPLVMGPGEVICNERRG